jgi:hypothetical protein
MHEPWWFWILFAVAPFVIGFGVTYTLTYFGMRRIKARHRRIIQQNMSEATRGAIEGMLRGWSKEHERR